MINEFLGTKCGRLYLSSLPLQDCVITPRLSQVCGVIVSPFGVALPTDWTSKAAVLATIDNDVSDNSAAKYLPGVGGIEEPNEITPTTGKDERRVSRRLFTLSMEVPTGDDERYEFLRELQTGWRAWRFWFDTVGGRLIGGQYGIVPDFLSVAFPYGGGVDDVEKGVLRVEWFADGDPGRATMKLYS